MELIFQKQQIEFNEIPSSEEVIKEINDLLEEGYYFSHFIADGNEIYEEHEAYLNINLDQIKRLEIVVKTEKEFLNDIFLSTEDYLKRATPELTVLSDGFYSNPTGETRSNFGQLLEGLKWLDEMLALVVSSNERPPNWEVYSELIAAMRREIAQLGEAVESGDNVLIADIIQYEFLPIFEQLEEIIGETLDTVGTRYDLS